MKNKETRKQVRLIYQLTALVSVYHTDSLKIIVVILGVSTFIKFIMSVKKISALKKMNIFPQIQLKMAELGFEHLSTSVIMF